MAFKDLRGDRTLLIIGTILTLLLVACSTTPGVSGAAEESPLLAALERKYGLILYLGLDRNLYTIDQAGGNQRAITTDADFSGENDSVRWYGHFAWSPEADRIAYVEIYGSVDSQSFSVFSAQADGTEPTVEFSSSLEVPEILYWQPNGSHISFLTSHPGEGEQRLRLSKADGSGDTELLAFGRPFFWAWKPNGEAVATHSGGALEANARAEIAIVNPMDGQSQSLDLEPGYFHAPAWSPDGHTTARGSTRCRWQKQPPNHGRTRQCRTADFGNRQGQWRLGGHRMVRASPTSLATGAGTACSGTCG